MGMVSEKGWLGSDERRRVYVEASSFANYTLILELKVDRF